MPILPGSTIGIFGGGQLGRMAAMAARGLGYGLCALDPDSACAARGVVDRCLTAGFDDATAAAALGRAADVVTLEIEKVAIASLEAAAAHAPVRPGAAVLSVVQDRALQKEWLARGGFPVGPFRRADDAAEIAAAVSAFGDAFVKTRRGGYDGRGQVRLDDAAQAAQALRELGGGPVVVEQALALQAELSVLVARSASGEVAVYPPAKNHHVDRVLDWSVIPGPFPEAAVRRAMELARGIAAELGVEGLLAVEIFLTEAGELLVNELSPRPHNTFHGTQQACVTDQFEQLVRAVCDLPLGSVEVLRPAAIVNLLGDLWIGAGMSEGQGPHSAARWAGAPDGGAARRDVGPPFAEALRLSGVGLHLYGKGPPRPGRKMGHLSAVGRTPDEALELVLAARARLRGVAI